VNRVAANDGQVQSSSPNGCPANEILAIAIAISALPLGA
jgi:hypothetical protein